MWWRLCQNSKHETQRQTTRSVQSHEVISLRTTISELRPLNYQDLFPKFEVWNMVKNSDPLDFEYRISPLHCSLSPHFSGLQNVFVFLFCFKLVPGQGIQILVSIFDESQKTGWYWKSVLPNSNTKSFRFWVWVWKTEYPANKTDLSLLLHRHSYISLLFSTHVIVS
jgi:hypothetical protein